MNATTRRQMRSALKDFPSPKRTTSKGRGPYAAGELEEFRTAMGKMADEIRRDIKAQQRILEDPLQSSSEQDHAAYLRGRQVQFLRQIEGAMARINSGAFGVCVSCGERIDKERLFAVPHTQLCIQCKSKGRSARKIVASEKSA